MYGEQARSSAGGGRAIKLTTSEYIGGNTAQHVVNYTLERAVAGVVAGDFVRCRRQVVVVELR